MFLAGEHINGDRALRGIVRRLSNHTRNVACPEIERVMFSENCRLSDRGMELLARRCPELTHLQIQTSYNVSSNALFHLTTKCTNLQHLDVTGSPLSFKLSQEQFKLIEINCFRLYPNYNNRLQSPFGSTAGLTFAILGFNRLLCHR